MALHHPQPSQAVDAAIRSQLSFLAAKPEKELNALAGSKPSELTMEAPHEVYTLGLDQLLEGAYDLTGAKPTGWRYLLQQASGTVASAETTADPRGQQVFSLINSGPFVGATVDALDKAGQLAGGADDPPLEPRLLQVPALHALALWLHGPGPDGDIVLPLDPSPPSVDGSRQYTVAEYLAALKETAATVQPVGRDDLSAG